MTGVVDQAFTSAGTIKLRAIKLSGFDMPSHIAALSGGAVLFCAHQGIGMVPQQGAPRLLVTAEKAIGHATGPDGATWFLLPRADAIAKIAADGSVQSATPFPANAGLQAIAGADGHVVVLMGTVRQQKFVVFIDGRQATIPVPGRLAMSIAYDLAERMIWYGDDGKISALSVDGGQGAAIDLPGGAASRLTFDPTNRRLWYYDEVHSVIGFAEGGRRVREFPIDQSPAPNLILDRRGHVWFVADNGARVGCCDGASLRLYDVSGLTDPNFGDVAITDRDEIACLDRWNAVLGIGPLPAGA